MTICKRRLFTPNYRLLFISRIPICKWLLVVICKWCLTLSCICDWLSMLIRKWCLSLSCISTRTVLKCIRKWRLTLSCISKGSSVYCPNTWGVVPIRRVPICKGCTSLNTCQAVLNVSSIICLTCCAVTGC